METNQINFLEEMSNFVKYEDVKNISLEEYYNGSALQVNVIKNKYLIEELGERTIADIFQRVAKYAAIPEIENKEYWERRWFHEMYTNIWIPGGSILSGANNPAKISLSNCTHLSIEEDTLENIFHVSYQVAKVAAYRQGLGVHFPLRPKGTAIHNSSKESLGNTHWMKFINSIGNYVGQKGRIPAMLFSIRADHPDFPEFITVKSDQKTIDNANISVHITDEFMKAVINNEDWEMNYITDSGEEVKRMEKANVLFDMFVKNNKQFAEPGAQFIDTIKRYSNSDYLVSDDWKVKGSNACSEQFLEYKKDKSCGLCVLASANYLYLVKFKDHEKAIKFLRYEVAPSMLRFQDNIVEMEIRDKRYPIEEQLHSLKNLRRVGIGITNVDGYLIENEIGYDTDEGIDLIFKLTDSLNLGLYETSIKLGKEKGNFLAFNKENYIQSPFIKQMIERHKLEFDTMRNVCVSSIAPTGTLSLVLKKAYTWGIEPNTALWWWKRERTSGNWKWYFVVADFVKEILEKKDIKLNMNGNSIEDPDGFKGEEIIKIINRHFPENKFKPAHEINPFKKIKLMSLLTKHCIDSAISVTYNLPENTTEETIKEIYLSAWKEGVKSISIYVDKSRFAVLEFEPPRIASKRYIEKEKPVIKKTKERSEDLKCHIHLVKIKGESYYCFIGLDEHSRPYEIFAGLADNIVIPSNISDGYIVRRKSGTYDLHLNKNEENEIIFKHITSQFKNPQYATSTRMISHLLRNSLNDEDLLEVIKTLSKDDNESLVSFNKVVSRVLRKYIADGKSMESTCPSCGTNNLMFLEGCIKCSCGYSRC